MIEYRNLRVALLGAGNVGSQVASMLLEHGAELAERAGAGLELVGIAVRDPHAKRNTELPSELFTTDAEQLIAGADIVIELMGGLEPARSHILHALNSGADVITGNKALLATHGAELFDTAEQVGAQLFYEAAVAGAIPIIRPLRESLAGDHINRIMGIVNGTTNFILDRMSRLGETQEQALAVATELGYAEADPTADIDGFDAAQKAAILAGLAFHANVPLESVYREGIRNVTLEQVESAARAGFVLKLLAICERIETADGSEGVSARVYPALIPNTHPLAAVHGAKNAVFIEADAAGDLMFYGAGAGGRETASAVLGDVVSAARRHVIGGPGIAESHGAQVTILPIDQIVTRYSVRLRVNDRPGVLATIATVFAEHGVSLETVEQTVAYPDTELGDATASSDSGDTGSTATLVIGTHRATEAALAATVEALAVNDAVRAVDSVLRVEGL